MKNGTAQAAPFFFAWPRLESQDDAQHADVELIYSGILRVGVMFERGSRVDRTRRSKRRFSDTRISDLTLLKSYGR
jgi:hypothetical protein